MQTNICTVEGCETHVYAKGLCNKHWQRARKYGDPNHPVRIRNPRNGLCPVESCERPIEVGGYCRAHYERIKRSPYGLAPERPFGPRATRNYKLGPRYRIEDRGYETPCWIWALYTTPRGYGIEMDPIRRRPRGAHRLAYEHTKGPIPDGFDVDHLCSQRACVNPDHLEAVSHADNVKRTAARGRARGGRGATGGGAPPLDAEKVSAVRKLLNVGQDVRPLSYREIARRCDVSVGSVGKIARGEGRYA